MAEYKVLYTDLLTGTILGELPVESFSWQDRLNSPGSLSLTMPIEPFSVAGVITVESFAPGRTGIYVDRDGVILWGGILWALRMSVDSGSVEAGAEGFVSYLRRRYLHMTFDYVAVDQDAIARDLLDYVTSDVPGGIAINYSANLHGVLRDRTYYNYEHKNIGDAIDQLANVQNGFDYFWSYSRSGSVITPRFNTQYPAIGRATSHVFEMGANIELLNYSLDGTSITNNVYALGQGDGPDRLYHQGFNSTSRASYPLLEDVVDAGDISELSTIIAHADRRLTRGGRPVAGLTVATYPDSVPGIGSYIVGDRVRVKGSYGLLDVDGMFRIVQLSVNVSPSGEAVDLELVEQELF